MLKIKSLRRFLNMDNSDDLSITPGKPIKPLVTFGISLASANIGKWEHTCQMLEYTLSCVLGQTDPRLKVLICGQDKPSSALLADTRVEFITCKRKRPNKPDNYRNDKWHKRILIGSRFRELGGGYFMPLDADDLIHKELVEYVLRDDNKSGYSVRQGYALDWDNKQLAPIPGAWDATFDQVCGSCTVFYFKSDELPVNGEITSDIIFNMFQYHAYWRVASQELGRPLADIPFPAVIYTINHSQNLSFNFQRNKIRQNNIIESIKRHQILDTNDILKKFAFRTCPEID